VPRRALGGARRGAIVIEAGQRAPEIGGTTGDGRRVSLADFRGRPLVLYFYPKDGTPVCTKEACGFRDHAAEIAALGAAVLGVSADSEASHARFAERQRLNFPLLSDPDGAIAKAFGVARLGGILGGWLPPRRVTFVIDGAGTVRRVIAGELDAGRHVDGALEALRELTAAGPR
jgi:peroxiredoxin Q/BCP